MVFAPDTDEDKLMEASIEAGAEDVVTNDDGSIEVITGVSEFTQVRDALQKAGFKPELAEVTMKPTTESTLAGEDAARMQKLLDAIESIDDVQEVYTNAVMDT
jgi:transcriptional/translational regulatory protein YebC/TACO1